MSVVVAWYFSNHVTYNQDLWYLMNPYCLLAIYLVTYVDAPGDLAGLCRVVIALICCLLI